MKHREGSRADFNTAGWNPTIQEINTGSLQRIADASEKMAANWITLTTERDRYKQWYENERDGRQRETARLLNVIRALRGVITRLKNQRGRDV